MNGIALFMEKGSVSYTALFVCLGAAAALICTIITAVMNRRRLAETLIFASVSMVTAPLLSRIVYWYCCPEQFDGFFSAFTGFGSGGFSLVGAFAGVLLAALIVRLAGFCDNLPALLDSIAPGAALGIAIGRLGGFFSDDDKGNYIFTDEKYHGLPLSVSVQDSVTGSVEWRFASFMWESIAAFVIFAALIVLLALIPEKGKNRFEGDIFMAFISLFGATQATLESTRYDALHMRSNGFISMMQMTALVLLLVPLVYYSVKTVRRERSWLGILPCCAISLAALGGAGVAEYLVQRKANYAMTIYPVQLTLLLLTSTMTLLLALRFHKADAPLSQDDSTRSACESCAEPAQDTQDVIDEFAHCGDELRSSIDEEFGQL